ncbi:phage integrase central domain-containing protein [Novosphingobium rhizovicinum]|uniref:phage integrase central domain-containing protein n=1 Tax=Novosphingobium rhizovicinum TaxID=3228928 RepID=UPI003B02A608
MASGQRPQWAEVQAADVLRSFEGDVFPSIGSLAIAAITPTQTTGGAAETAKRLRPRISGVYAYAIASGIAESDPAEKVGAALEPMPRRAISRASPTSLNCAAYC